MIDVIQLLPESVANQIAAGEVVQRPASVVKELMENAIDAGATRLQLIVRDAGKTLIQVIDNGCGMSETDARMSFERHATSKIRESKDLFALQTMGFRGEALASIAAVAQVELKTRRMMDELGTRILIEDSAVRIQEPCQTPQGTSIAVKNLFFNVPARRNFLKADPVEMRHIMDEFQRIAMAHPDLFFSLHHNDQELFHLPAGNLRQRIVKIFGDAVNKKLVPVQQDTDILTISGFVGKPDYFKKSRGEQFFFVNKRFIKSAYLQHAVVSAYEELLPADTYPLFVLFLEIEPSRIDINVHPTKQEIKFDDEKLVYNYLKVSVRHALGSHNVTPMLDFEQEPAFSAQPVRTPSSNPAPPTSVGDYKLGGSGKSRENTSPDPDQRHASNLRNWQRLYENLDLAPATPTPQPVERTEDETVAALEQILGQSLIIEREEVAPPVVQPSSTAATTIEMDDAESSFSKGQKEPYQIHLQYIVSHIKSGFLLIDQQAASERILFERYLGALGKQPMPTQKVLFPRTLELPPADAVLLRDILDEVNRLGFEIAEFGGNAFVVHGIPAELTASNISEEKWLEKLLFQYKNQLDLSLNSEQNLARAMARSAAVRRGQPLSITEMQDLIDGLFACEMPYASPFGKKTFVTFGLDEIQKRLS
ncbi:MAG: DNA mismatch repair endonuclease MutL [Saprospiraceae bacterium]|nr:DNA mismatch repair endonuclease MutL [Saprospiraceae bacterium]